MCCDRLQCWSQSECFWMKNTKTCFNTVSCKKMHAFFNVLSRWCTRPSHWVFEWIIYIDTEHYITRELTKFGFVNDKVTLASLSALLLLFWSNPPLAKRGTKRCAARMARSRMQRKTRDLACIATLAIKPTFLYYTQYFITYADIILWAYTVQNSEQNVKKTETKETYCPSSSRRTGHVSSW